MRNVVEDMIVRQANRVAAMENPGKEDLMVVLPEDLEDPEENEEADAAEETAASAEAAESAEEQS